MPRSKKDELYEYDVREGKGPLEKLVELLTEEEEDFVDMLEDLLSKQKILYTRLSLSDDPEAKMMKENIIKSAQQLGFPPNVDLGYVFSNMSSIIESMKKAIREGS